jgi:xanthine dehydrogenase YagS FAD-binding subunit
MRSFTYERPLDVEAAVRAVAQNPSARFIGGGTNLLDLMKDGVEQPAHLVDINRLPLNGVERLPEGGLRLGALARNSDVAAHAEVRAHYPLLSQALLDGATGQLRNMATIGGNLLQRTRCYYFMDTGFPECNKRQPGTGCSALQGYNRIHAILGASDRCVATHPSDMAVALAALDAVVQVRGPQGTRAIRLGEFHRLPGEHPEIDTTLQHGELITAVDLPARGFAEHYHYLKVRDRASYAFALVSAAVGLDLDGSKIRELRLALGGVAHKPWRVPAAEGAAVGLSVEPAALTAVADAALSGAQPLQYNAFKMQLARRVIVRAVLSAAGKSGGGPT